MTATVRTGLDLVEVERFRVALERHPGLMERVFTAAEAQDCSGKGDPARSLAARFAAKEAVGKLLGTGVLTWPEIEVLPGPRVVLSGRTAALAASQGIVEIAISLTHTDTLAGATASALAMPAGTSPPATAEDLERLVVGASSEAHPAHPAHPAPGDVGRLLPLSDRPEAFSGRQVRELDRATIGDVGVSGQVLMERAALGITRLVVTRFAGRHTLVVCGRGNNGGDGLAAARQLHQAGHPVACVVAGREEDLSADAAVQLRSARAVGVNLRLESAPDYLWEESEVVLDCLLGTGARAELRPPVAEWAARVNALGARGVPVVAVDVPTGVDADTGETASGVVAATCTVAFHAAKTGTVCPPGSEAAGEVVVWDIGIPRFLEPAPDVRVVTAAEVAVPGRRPDDHKYRAGFVAVVAGSRDFPGAAYLAASAAARCGAGYVRLVTAGGAASVLRERLVEVVVEEADPGEALTDPGGTLDALADDRISALVVGPGLGRHPDTMEVVRCAVAGEGPPVLLDADGILAFVDDPGALAGGRSMVLTPHAGELAALLGESVSQVADSALRAARRGAERTGQVVVLKGSSTVVAAPGGETWVIAQGPAQLASAGTGDVLSGCIGALLAAGMPPLEAAKAGVWLHAEAGRRGAAVYVGGLLAQDVLELLPVVLAEHVFERRPGWSE
ncbi:MAG: NAD(P)H-hydrate dehydratase [Thermoleophilia bacterium]